MGPDFYVFVGLAALALACLFWAISRFWRDTRGVEPQRISRRIRSAAGTPLFVDAKLASPQHSRWNQWAEAIERRLPGIAALRRLIAEAGSSGGLSSFAAWSLLLPLTALLVGGAARQGAPVLIAGAMVAALLPIGNLLRRRNKRMGLIEAQIPDALHLMVHAMQAGRSLASALRVVGSEGPSPIASEFRKTFDEINFGLSEESALANLAARVRIGDLRYFVVAVRIQRETGGNLAELLLSIAALVRQRIELRGSIRVMSAEGRLSAWILGLMPFIIAGAIAAINPKFLMVLWTDPVGINMVVSALALQSMGLLWMWRIIKIRV